jgi:hypothetical protein
MILAPSPSPSISLADEGKVKIALNACNVMCDELVKKSGYSP